MSVCLLCSLIYSCVSIIFESIAFIDLAIEYFLYTHTRAALLLLFNINYIDIYILKRHVFKFTIKKLCFLSSSSFGGLSYNGWTQTHRHTCKATHHNPFIFICHLSIEINARYMCVHSYIRTIQYI